MVSKTRDKFIEVAKQLFARKGVENTTMNDIASASDKGRRTIYTYFKSKTEILNAVVESESDQLLKRLRLIVVKPATPEEKVAEYIESRIDYLYELTTKGGKMRWLMLRELKRSEKKMAIVSRNEVQLFADILKEGVSQGVFDVDEPVETSIVVTHAIYGLCNSHVRESLREEGVGLDELKHRLVGLVLDGLRTR